MLMSRTVGATAALWVWAASAAFGQQTVTFEAEGASEGDLRGGLELRIDGESVEIEGVARAESDWRTLVYVDLALTTPGPVFQLAEVLLEQLDPLLEAGSLEIVVANPQARTILPPTRDRDLAEAALSRLATGEEASSALVDRRRLFTSERDIEFSRARQQAAAGSRDRLTELEVVLEQMARDAIREEAAMRSNQIDEIVLFLAAREDLRRDAPSATQSTRRHLVLLADGLVTDPLSFYLELVPTAGSLAVEAATIPDLGGVARAAAAFGWTAAPVAFAANENGDGVRVRSNEVTVGFTLRFNRPRTGASQTVEEELGLFVQPSDWTVAADATGGEVLLNEVAIANWIGRLPSRFEASFELPGGAAAAGAFDLSDGAGEIDAPTVTPGAGSPDDVAEVRLRRAFEGELDSEFEGGDAGVEVVASIRIESASPERVVGRLTSTIVPPAGSPPADASTWRVSTGLHREDGSVVTSHGVPFAVPGGENLTFERPLQLPPGTDSAIVLAENLRDGRWGYAVVDFLDLVEQAVDAGTAGTRAISLRPEDPRNRRGRATFVAEVLDPFIDQVERVVFYFNGRRVAARNRAPYRARIDLGRGDRLGRVEAVAFDAEDRELDRHELLVNQPPHAFWVRITEPEEGLLAGPVEVAAELKLPRGGRLLEMRFFVKDRLAGTATEAPFRREVLVPVGDPESYLRVEAQLTDGRIAEDVLFLSRPGLSARIGVELVQLYVVATDRSGQPVRDLTAGDFSVFEDDRAQELESFRIAFDLPLTLGLAIDTSSSLFLRMPDVKRAAVEFLDSLEPTRDRAFLVGFGSEPRLVRAATYNLNAVRGGIGALRPRGRTAVWGALSLALDQLEGLRGRKALVVFYDGDDEDSDAAFRQSLDQARRARVPVYLVLMNDEAARTDGRSFSTRTFVSKLERMARAGGGRVYYVRHDQDLEPIFDSISRELRSHYLLTYYPKEEPGGPNWREVSVELDRTGVLARTIEGREVR
ncbi:MAG: VWA domain-containing protein [Holophagales bacterium]|nr:VWA domain-containing protein [Holophagales bacterium]MXX60974.1 VWA domain-containing protein [Holophagales bacterium]MYC11796.1 VWA domain-containing protein [Holophagales bacterium]MYI34132.1 VWA domain-containing protein [Holophagales bacterium]